MQVFLNLAKNQPQLLSDYVLKIKKAAECNPNALCIAAQVLSAVGKINKVFIVNMYLKIILVVYKNNIFFT